MSFYKNRIVEKVLKLTNVLGISKSKLGEVLGVDKEASTQSKISKINRFLDTKNPRINIEQLERLADFFSKPIEYFLSETKDYLSRIEIEDKARVPLLGNVSAAKLDYAAQDISRWLIYPYSNNAEGIFALRVAGDCMAPGINNGDIVFVSRVDNIIDGQVYVIRVDSDQATLKRLYRREDNTVELRPDNPQYSSITLELTEDFKILGMVTRRITEV